MDLPVNLDCFSHQAVNWVILAVESLVTGFLSGELYFLGIPHERCLSTQEVAAFVCPTFRAKLSWMLKLWVTS